MRWLLALLVALWMAPLHAQDVQPVPPLSGRVIDTTGTLTPVQAQALGAKLAQVEQERGSQLVVLIVPTTQPEDIAAYTQRVAAGPRQPNARRPPSSAANTTQPSIENTVLWSQRQGFA